MASCLSVMLGRSSAFLGVNAIGALISANCEATFYGWAVLLLSKDTSKSFIIILNYQPHELEKNLQWTLSNCKSQKLYIVFWILSDWTKH